MARFLRQRPRLDHGQRDADGANRPARLSAAAANTGTSSLVLAKPTGTVDGDVLLAAVTVRGTPTITPPAAGPWSAPTRGPTAMRQAVFVHVRGR